MIQMKCKGPYEHYLINLVIKLKYQQEYKALIPNILAVEKDKPWQYGTFYRNSVHQVQNTEVGKFK